MFGLLRFFFGLIFDDNQETEDVTDEDELRRLEEELDDLEADEEGEDCEF